jgi:hypothetical protein
MLHSIKAIGFWVGAHVASPSRCPGKRLSIGREMRDVLPWECHANCSSEKLSRSVAWASLFPASGRSRAAGERSGWRPRQAALDVGGSSVNSSACGGTARRADHDGEDGVSHRPPAVTVVPGSAPERSANQRVSFPRKWAQFARFWCVSFSGENTRHRAGCLLNYHEV